MDNWLLTVAEMMGIDDNDYPQPYIVLIEQLNKHVTQEPRNQQELSTESTDIVGSEVGLSPQRS